MQQPEQTTPCPDDIAPDAAKPAGPGLLTHPGRQRPGSASNCDAGTPVENEGADHD